MIYRSIAEAVEVWMVVKFDDKYMISSIGRIKTIATGLIRIGNLHRNGYLKIRFSTKTAYYVHRVVAMHFIENPENKPQVNHKGVKTDNRVWLLEWVTKAEHAIDTATYRMKRKLEPVIQIDSKTGEQIYVYDDILDTNKDGFSSGKIRHAIKENRRHGGYKWAFKNERPVEKEIEGEKWGSLKDSIYEELNKYSSYTVSDHGRVKSKGKLMHPSMTSGQACIILINTDADSGICTKKAYRVGRLVLMGFNVPNPENKPEVDHIDSNHNNDCLSNLRWATRHEQMNNVDTRKKIKKSHIARAQKRKPWVQCITPKFVFNIVNLKKFSKRVGIIPNTIKKYAASGKPYKGLIFKMI